MQNKKRSYSIRNQFGGATEKHCNWVSFVVSYDEDVGGWMTKVMTMSPVTWSGCR